MHSQKSIALKCQRDATFEGGSKCIIFLATEGTLRYATGIVLMNYNEIVESDDQGLWIDIDKEDYFDEESVEGDIRMKRILNPNRKTHRETHAKTCEEFLDKMDIER